MALQTPFSEELRTPRSAAIAGIAFALILAAVIVRLRVSGPESDGGGTAWLTDAQRRSAVSTAMNLVPFAGIAFLWFIGVVRSRLGTREDKLFATVFLGPGLLFVALLFAGRRRDPNRPHPRDVGGLGRVHSGSRGP